MKNTQLIITILFVTQIVYANTPKTAFKFVAGEGSHSMEHIALTPELVYSDNTGYGFDFGTSVELINHKSLFKSRRQSVITSQKPFYFSVDVPEGNYLVTITFGNRREAANLTVKAESRRLMLENLSTKPGEILTRSFVVNVRKPEISTGGRVRLKEREVTKLDWDEKLTLEFNGSRPCISSIEIKQVHDQITVYLAGNSTVVNQGEEPWASWGQMITRFFRPGVSIANHAESGLALASFRSQNRLDKVLSLIKPGDYLFIEFGHNDQKMTGPNDGPWKSYSDNLRHFIREARNKQAIPVVVTPTARRRFDEHGKLINTLDDFPAAGIKVAQEERVALIDLNAMTTILYETLGVEGSKNAFVHYPANTFPGQTQALADNTHFNAYGAYLIAKCVIQGIRENELNLADFVIDMPSFDPGNPSLLFENFHLPLSPGMDLIKPDGD